MMSILNFLTIFIQFPSK